jgi:hypothetical protein
MGKLPPGKSRWRSRRLDQTIAGIREPDDLRCRLDLACCARWHGTPYRIH